MATTLTTSYKDIASANVTPSGYSVTFKVTVQAKYVNQSGSNAQIRIRAVVKNTSSLTWTGTNKGVTLTIGSSTSSEQTWSGNLAAGGTWTSNEKTSGNISGGTTTTVKAKLRVINTTGTASGSTYMPVFETAPATPTCSAAANSASLVNVSWSISDLGTPTGSVSLYNGTTNNPTNLLQTKTTTGSWTFGNDQRTANTEYFYKAVATNSAGSATSSIVSAITYPAGITSITTSNITTTSANIDVTCASSGSSDTTYLQVSTNGTTWTTYSNIPDVHGRTISTIANNLTPDTQYTRYYRVHNSVGNSAVTSVTFRTLKPVHLYGSVNSQTKEVKKLYGSVNGQTKEVKKLYGSLNGQTKLIYQA